jgi:hypothetical protein
MAEKSDTSNADARAQSDSPVRIPEGSKILIILDGGIVSGTTYPPVRLWTEPSSLLLSVEGEKRNNIKNFMMCRYIHDRIVNDFTLWKKDYDPSKVYYEKLTKDIIYNMAKIKEDDITYIFGIFKGEEYYFRLFGEGITRKDEAKDINVYIFQLGN